MVQVVCPECHQPLSGVDATAPPTMCPYCGIHLQFDGSNGTVLPPTNRDWTASAQPTGQPWFVPDGAYLRVHRSVAYTQAVLLALVAIVAFVLGAGFGGLYSSSSEVRNLARTPCDIRGQVTRIRREGQELGEDDAVVIFLPADRVPDERWPISGLRPEEDLPPSDHPTLIGIRLLGGAYTKTDPRGLYSSRVAAAGDYFALVLTVDGRRRRDADWNKRDLAQIGRYFQNAIELLAGREYRWQKLTITPGERWDVAFAPNSP